MTMASRAVVVAALLMGAGCSLGVNSVLGGVGFFTMRFGESSFLWLTLALYLPALPIAVGVAAAAPMTACDDQGQHWCDARRVVLAFVGQAALLIVLPSLSTIGTLLLVCALLSACGGVAMAYSFQMALRAARADTRRANDGVLEASLSFGLQASCLVCLVAQTASGFAPMAPHSSVEAYFGSLGFLSVMFIFAVLLFTKLSLNGANVGDAAAELDMEGAAAAAAAAAAAETEPLLESDPDEVVGWLEALTLSSTQALTLFLTLFASMVVFPFYAFVPSSGTGADAGARLATILFYVKTLSDGLSRPATVALPPLFEHPRRLLAAATARLVFLAPAFFLYIVFSAGTSDVLFCLFIAVYSAGSGYLNTASLQLLPSKGLSPKSVSRLSSVMSVTFQLAVSSGLLTALVLRYTVFHSLSDHAGVAR